MNFLKGLIRLAKADDHIDETEISYFQAAGSQLGLAQNELDDLNSFWTQAELKISFDSNAEKVLFLREALQLCAVDNRYDDTERTEILQMCRELDVPIKILESLETWVEEGMTWKIRGDEFLNITW